MSELVQLVEQQNMKIDHLTKMVEDLTLLVMKPKLNDTWINEDIAAQMLGYKNGISLRRKVIAGKGKFTLIHFRTNNGRNYQYNLKSIRRYQEETSTIN